jgi:hypothetical protein
MTSQSLDDVPFDIANYRVILYVQNITGCRDLYQKLDQAVKELMIALDRTNNPFQEVLSTRSSLRLKDKDKVPLAKFIDFSQLVPLVRDFFQKNKIIYLTDLNGSSTLNRGAVQL